MTAATDGHTGALAGAVGCITNLHCNDTPIGAESQVPHALEADAVGAGGGGCNAVLADDLHELLISRVINSRWGRV